MPLPLIAYALAAAGAFLLSKQKGDPGAPPAKKKRPPPVRQAGARVSMSGPTGTAAYDGTVASNRAAPRAPTWETDPGLVVDDFDPEDVIGPVWSYGAPTAAPPQSWSYPDDPNAPPAAELGAPTVPNDAPSSGGSGNWWADAAPSWDPLSFNDIGGSAITDPQSPPPNTQVHPMAGSYGAFEWGVPPVDPTGGELDNAAITDAQPPPAGAWSGGVVDTSARSAPEFETEADAEAWAVRGGW